MDITERSIKNKTLQWAIAAGGALTRVRQEKFDQLLPASSLEEIKSVLSGSWGVGSRDSLLHTLSWLRDDGDRQIFLELRSQLARIKSEEELKWWTDGVRAEDLLPYQLTWQNLQSFPSLVAWDFQRIINVARWGFGAEYLDEAEAKNWIIEAAKTIQSTYSSWQELGEAYLYGRKLWNKDRSNTASFEEATQWLLTDQESPWLKLSWEYTLSSSLE